MERPGQPSLNEVKCWFFVVRPSILLFCENTSAVYVLNQTVSRTAQKGIWGDDTLQQLHPAGGTTASGLCSKSHKRKREILVFKIEIFILEAKKCFCFGIPTRIPSSDSVAAGGIRPDQSWCGSSDSAACSGPAAAGCTLPSWTVWLHTEMGAGIVQCFALEQTHRGETSLTSIKFNWICVCVMGAGTGGFSAPLQWLPLQTGLYGRKRKAATAVKLENGETEAINGKCYVSSHHNME